MITGFQVLTWVGIVVGCFVHAISTRAVQRAQKHAQVNCDRTKTDTDRYRLILAVIMGRRPKNASEHCICEVTEAVMTNTANNVKHCSYRRV